MEYFFGIVAVIFIVIVLGNIKGAPDPKTMSDSQIQSRLQTEGAWIKKFYRLPFEHQLNLTLQKKYEEKKKYIQELKLEFASRQTSPNIVPNFQNISIEMQPILDKINEHKQSGLSEPDAIKATLVQYRDKDSVSLKNADTIQKNPTEITKDRLGNVIKVDQRSEEEKEIAFRKHIQNKRG